MSTTLDQALDDLDGAGFVIVATSLRADHSEAALRNALAEVLRFKPATMGEVQARARGKKAIERAAAALEVSLS